MQVRRWDAHLVVWRLNRVSVTADRDTFWLLEGWVPSLNDPATLGCLRELVRRANGVDVCWTEYRHSPGEQTGWRVNVHDRGRDAVISSGPTEAEALVAALESAP